MRDFLESMAVVAIISVVAVLAGIAFDYANWYANNREMQRLIQESRESEDRSMLEICKIYRQFQKTPDGRETTAMDKTCSELEERYK